MPTGTVSTVLPDEIYAELRRDILSQESPAGSTFTESAVAERFGVARPTAKMAIERLVTEGLLRRETHHPARVPELSREDVADLFENRTIIETAAIGKLAVHGTIPAGALAAHRALLASDEPDPSLDIEFHRALVTGQGSPRLIRAHSLLMGEIELCIGQVLARRLRTAAEVSRQHQGILDAVTAGNDALAEGLTREHIAESRDRLLAQFKDGA
jgi:DNA-binding GntR family transcriptional regulator